MTKGLLLYPEQYGFHAPSFAYVKSLRRLGFDMYYGGNAFLPANSAPPFAFHADKAAGTLAFAKFGARLVDELQPDFVHILHYRGAGLTRLYSKYSRRTKWLMEVRTVHVEDKHQNVTKFPYLKDRLTWMETLVYDKVFANTETIRRHMLPARHPIPVIPTGASWEEFNSLEARSQRVQVRQRFGYSDHHAVMLYAGTLSRSRNLDRMIAAFAEAVKRYPHARLLMVGGSANVAHGKDPASDNLRRQVAELGLAHHVTFTGRIPFVEVPAYYAAADIGISYTPPGTGYETQWPRKLIEIMMAGLIPVTNITVGAREVYVRDDAVVACGSTVSDLTEAMCRAFKLMTPEERDNKARLIATARARAKELDWETIIAEHLLPIYASVGIAANRH